MHVRANKFREVEGERAAWYASRTEAVGLGRVVLSSFYSSFQRFPPEVTPLNLRFRVLRETLCAQGLNTELTEDTERTEKMISLGRTGRRMCL